MPEIAHEQDHSSDVKSVSAFSVTESKNESEITSKPHQLTGSLEELLEEQLHLVQQYTTTNDVKLLLALIQVQRQIFTFRPVGHPSRHIACYNLAFSLRMLYNVQHDVPLIIEAIDLHYEALELRPRGHPLRGISCVYLASNLSEMYTNTGNVSFLENSIALDREALACHPKRHPARPLTCFNLAACLNKLFDRNGDEGISEEALAFGREALSLLPDGHPEQSMFRRNLASELISRYNRTNKMVYIDEAVELSRDALSLCPVGHPERALACANLASSLRHQSSRNNTELLILAREALSLSQVGDPRRAGYCSSLATYLDELYDDSGDVKLLFESIEKGREAVSLQTPGHPDWAMACSDLARAMAKCYDCTYDDALLRESIGLDLDALEIFGTGHPYRVTIMSNFASNLERRFLRFEDRDALNDAVRVSRDVLQLLPEEHSDRGGATVNLASSLRSLGAITGDDAISDEVMGLWQAALTLCPPSHSLHTTCVLCYASSLNESYKRKGNEEYLTGAITVLQHLLPLQSNEITSISLSLTLAELYLHPASAHYAPALAISHLKAALKPNLYQPLRTWRAASRILKSLLIVSDIPQNYAQDLLYILSSLIDMLPLLVNHTLPRNTQLTVLRQTRTLGSEAMRVALHAHEETKGVELLERTRGLIWSQALSLKDVDIGKLPADMAHEATGLLRDISAALEVGDSELESGSVITAASARMLSSAKRNHLHRQTGLLQQCLHKIRSMPGLGGFMLGMSYTQLRQCATDHPVVILLSTTEGSHAFMISSSEDKAPSILPLSITQRELHQLAMVFHKSPSQQPDRRCARESGRGMTMTHRQPYSDKLEMLWRRLVQPILKSLGIVDLETKKRTRIHWCTTGDFMFLPLHAAGVYKGSGAQCCMDYVVSSYTPTLSALLRAASNRRVFARQDLSLLLVAEPKAALSGLPTLFSVREELSEITSVAHDNNLSAVTVQQGNTTKQEVSEALTRSPVVHLACHGIQDPTNALASGFCLGDGTMTVSEIMNLKLGDAFLAFLSACETARGDEQQPDDVVHLAAAMLFSGFRSVVATMWAMGDVDGPVVAEEFYRTLLSQEVIDYEAVPFALDAAVSRLRKQGVPPERWATFIHVGA